MKVKTIIEQKKSLVFFGSGPVAASSLELLAKNFEIEAVITKSRPQHHHGSVPVIELAQSLGLKAITVASKTELDNIFSAKPLSSKIAVLIDFGIIVSQAVIDYFPLGIVNSHFSILPEWRGADPITFSLLSGQEVTGVSLMLLVEAMDEGPLIATEEYSLSADENSVSLTDNLIKISDHLLSTNLDSYLKNPQTQPQDSTGKEVSYSRKLSKEDGRIDWTKSANEIEREIRAFYEWPKSTGNIGTQTLIIRQARVVGHAGVPGTYIVGKHSLVVNCGQNALEIQRVQPPGKKEMPIEAFLAGNQL